MRHIPDTDDVQRMIDRAIAAERQRLLAALAKAAEAVGGPVQLALDAIIKELSDAR